MRFNTGISAMMEFVNGATKWGGRPRAALEPFVLLLSPYAPHIAEELWHVRSSIASRASKGLGYERAFKDLGGEAQLYC